MAKASKKSAQDLLAKVRTRYRAMVDADRENRRLAMDDLEFIHVPGMQWDEHVKRERGDVRPTYEFNKLRVTIKRIVNDMRANRPQGKVRAVEDNDKDTAEVMEGLCRNIWNVSDGDTVIDYAAEYQVGGGMGAWRINTKYSSDTAFDQEIYIESIKNPFCLYADPGCQDPLKRDAWDWILTTKLSRKSFESKYPNADPVEFESTEFDDDDEWQDEDSVRVAEYWWKEPQTKTLVMLSNGVTAYAEEVEAQAESLAAAGIGVIKTRDVQCYKIKSAIVSGDAILEGPADWAGSQFPFVLVYGEHVVIDGKTYWFGLTRFAKDAQRAYNYARTSITETIALAPQAKFWATPVQAKGHETHWAEAHKKLYPFMLANPDPAQPGFPQRMPGAEVPVALIQESQFASEDIKAVTGIFDNSLGAQGNETSGRAITARQRQGEIATFNYADNLAKGIRRTWEILIDLVPKIYDTERSVRILGADGAEKYAKVNTIDPQTGQALNDISRGKFDVTVTVGPSFSTQRQEAAELYMQIAQAFPPFMQVAGDLAFKSMDVPYSEQIAERMTAALLPQVQQMIQQKNEGQMMPPEVLAKMAQLDQAAQMVEEKAQLVQAAELELKELQAQAKGDQASAKLAQANIQTAEAQLEARFKELELAQKELALVEKEVANARVLLAKDVEIATLKIQAAHEKASMNLERQGHAQDVREASAAAETAAAD